MSLKKEKAKRLKEVLELEKNNFNLQSYYYSIFSANINKFLPNIDRKEYKKLFYDTIYNQHCAALEQSSKEYLESSKIINNSGFNLGEIDICENIIFATFHLGSYKTIITYLYNIGFKVVLIIDDAVFNSQLEVFHSTVKNVIIGKPSSDLVILNVKERTSIIRLKKLVESGYVMAVYLDGNSGINVEPQDFSKSYISINFLNQILNVKYGVGKLAAILNAKVIPLLSYRNEKEENTIEIFKQISIDDYEDKEEFSKKAIEKCYSLLEKNLYNFPAQWECWGYIHKWFNRNLEIKYDEPSVIVTKFNENRYVLFEVNGGDFIFDLFSYTSFPISKEILTAIQCLNFENLDVDLVQELKEKNILI